MRNLAPSGTFLDPRALWPIRTLQPAQTRGPSSGKKKKSDVIRERQDARREQDTMQKEIDAIAHATQRPKTAMSMLIACKTLMTTSLGRTRWMLEVLRWAQKRKDQVTMFDCLFSLLENPVFQKGRKETAGPEYMLLRENQAVVQEATVHLRQLDDVFEFQMTVLSNRLPPLSKFQFGRSLDEWQKRVLGYIDQKRSVLVCAPTSAGKTVLSTYLTLQAEKILFVVPSEPLVWQVGAMFAHVLGGEVALVTNHLVYNPRKENPRDWRCVVGTPLALESALTKPRGRYGAEAEGKQDYTCLRAGFHDFHYVVYDEVHSLDGEEGAALERIIKSVRCNFLALSATLGNPEYLRQWWETLHTQHITDEIQDIQTAMKGMEDVIQEENGLLEMYVKAVKMKYIRLPPGITTADDIAGKWKSICRMKQIERLPEANQVLLVDHHVRFINLQRWIFVSNKFHSLHPLAALTNIADFSHISLPFTPRDSWTCWEEMQKHLPEKELQDIDPDSFFQGRRITLERAKDFEALLKQKLQTTTYQKEVRTILSGLSGFLPDASSSRSTPGDDEIWNLMSQLKENAFFPAIFFRLETCTCQELFLRCLRTIETQELKAYPDYYHNLQKQHEQREIQLQQAEAYRQRMEKLTRRKTTSEDGTVQVETIEHDEDDVLQVVPEVDITLPHPEFTLVSPVNRLSTQELEDILTTLEADGMHKGHPYVQALRRGIGMYIHDPHLQEYHVSSNNLRNREN